ncbi:MAG: RNA polymerase sigma factor [Cytophagales bacterium]|nr:RNA polymerase sigma factor [Cytophagales bacterium]
MEDKEILQKFSEPDTRNAAFNQLVRKYQKMVYWHIRKMVIDHDDADDLTQDTFIKAYKSLDNFRGDAKIYTWLYRIATNECLNFLNKKRKKFLLPIYDVENELLQKIDTAINPEIDQVQVKLQKALLKLPEKQRLVFNMKYYDDLKYDDISEILGTSVGALKASYHLAVKKIEEYINNH